MEVKRSKTGRKSARNKEEKDGRGEEGERGGKVGESKRRENMQRNVLGKNAERKGDERDRVR